MQDTYYALNPWWEGGSFATGVQRDSYVSNLFRTLKRRPIEVVSGGRRVGKTTIVKQLVSRLLEQGVRPSDILYLALDHPRLSPTSISEHVRFFRGLHGHKRAQRLWLLLDEVQESPNWEAELKALYDTENLKIVCTGSTAALIKSQGGKLTGRQVLLTVHPLSFQEFLEFRELHISRAEDYRYVSAADDYLQTGGYPEHVLEPSEEALAQLLDDIVARDLVRHREIRRPDVIFDLLRLLAAAVGSRTSYNRLSHTLRLSVDTVKEYISHLDDAYLVHTLEKWTPSHSERTYAARKIYFADTSFKSLLTGRGDWGAKAENAVYMDFVRRGLSCGYYAESEREVDFVSGTPKHPECVEVKYDNDFDWTDRRFGGVRLFLSRYPHCKRITVVTRDASADLEDNGVRIQATPLWRYLLRPAVVVTR